MLAAVNRQGLALALVVGCADPASDDGDVDSTGAVTTTDDGETAPESSTTTPSTTNNSDTDATTGGCEPAAFTEVEGCAQVVGQGFCSEGGMHLPQDTEIAWMSDPPHSGPHYPMWETWGEHELLVPRGNWVHNLEHGGIVLGYRCNDDCLAEREVLAQVIAMRPELRILMTRDPLLPGDERFSAISWTWVHRFDEPDLAELLCFVDQHENHAPEDVP
jgi:hypothetical protein